MKCFKKGTFAALAGSLLIPMSGVGYAQIRPGFAPAPNPGRFPASPAARPLDGRDARLDARNRTDEDHLLRVSAIIGTPVNFEAGARFGTIQDVFLSPQGCVDYAVVNYNNQFVPIPWDLGMYQYGRHVWVVNIDPGRIREFPRYARIDELNNGRFRQRVNTFFRGDRGRAPMRGDRGGEFRGENRGEQNPGHVRPNEATSGGRPNSAPAPNGGASIGNRQPSPAPSTAPAGSSKENNRGNSNRGER